ncbi:MAG: hypothetical protein PHD72_00885 [Patescibacteria group bacterium]|nr:hypothetical protein [Patescibacteria group bacterium]
MNKYFKLFLALVALGLFYANIKFWHLFPVGLVTLLAILWYTALGLEKLLAVYFDFELNLRTKIIAGCLALSLIGWLAGAVIVFGRLTAGAIAMVALAVILTSYFFQRKLKVAEQALSARPETTVEVPQSRYYLAAYIIFWAFGLYLLWSGRTDAVVVTPWQTIPANYIYLFFLAVLTLGGLFLSRFSAKILLIFLVAQSFLTFSYLPLSHKLFYGADGWRHAAAVAQVVEERVVSVRNFAEHPSLLEKINPGVFAYAQFWGVEAVLARGLSVDLISFSAWFQPIVASAVFILLLWEIGLTLGWGAKRSLFFCWLGLWPFALQAVGSFSLPVSLGFLIWLLLFVLLLKRAVNPRPAQIGILCALGVLSVFGYSLYLILFWLAFGILEISRHKGKIFFVGAFAVSILILPVLELLAGYGRFDSLNNFWSNIKQLIGNFTAYYLASGPRPHIIETGNIFFNQTPADAFVPNGFTDWRWWLVALMVAALFGMFIGWRKFWRGSIFDRWLAILGGGLFIGYFISRYFLVGSQLISRRLDAVIALFGIMFLFNAIKNIFKTNKFASVLFILVGATAVAASYSLGPVSTAMSTAQYDAAGQVWRESKNETPHCVVADTYTLLALEAISQKQIIGGGFPIDKNFGQLDLTALYDGFKNNPGDELWQKARHLTGANECFLIIDGKISSKKF